jgi:hypothetical protein
MNHIPEIFADRPIFSRMNPLPQGDCILPVGANSFAMKATLMDWICP